LFEKKDKRFECHKIILACVSDYFRSMFTSGMKESTQSEIELKGVNAIGLGKVIEIVYASPNSSLVDSGHGDTSVYELFDTVATASHLQCFLVIDFCEKSLIGKLDFSNLNYFLQMAKIYSMNGLLAHIDTFIARNLARIVRYNRDYVASGGGCFLKSLSYDQLLNCLLSDQLRIKEIDLFYIVWKWIYLNLFSSKRNKLSLNRFDLHKKFRSFSSPTAVAAATTTTTTTSDETGETSGSSIFGLKKIEMIRNLLKHIRYTQIAARDLIGRVQTVNKIMLSDSSLRKMVLGALNYQLAPQLYPHMMHERLRCPTRTIFIVGGREINPLPTIYDSCHSLNNLFTSSSHYGSSNLVNKVSVSTLPNVLSHMQCAVTSDNYLYVMGGCLSQCVHGESATNTVLRYDPRLNKWIFLRPMLEKRAYFYACTLVVNGVENIFVFGGKNRDGKFSSLFFFF
jgi:hypothetical protein